MNWMNWMFHPKFLPTFHGKHSASCPPQRLQLGLGTCIQTMETKRCRGMLSPSVPPARRHLFAASMPCTLWAISTTDWFLTWKTQQLKSCNFLKGYSYQLPGKQLPATWPSLCRNFPKLPKPWPFLQSIQPTNQVPLNRSFLLFQTKLLVMQISGSQLNSKVDEMFWKMLMSSSAFFSRHLEMNFPHNRPQFKFKSLFWVFTQGFRQEEVVRSDAA